MLNRFWLATLVFGVSITAFGVANKIKMEVRTEPILPADFSFISGGNTGNIMSFVPEDRQAFVNGAVSLVTWFAIICIAFFHIRSSPQIHLLFFPSPHCKFQECYRKPHSHSRSGPQRSPFGLIYLESHRSGIFSICMGKRSRIQATII